MKGVQRHTAGMYTHFLGHHLKTLRCSRSYLTNSSSLIAPLQRPERSQHFRNFLSSTSSLAPVLKSNAEPVQVDAGPGSATDVSRVGKVGVNLISSSSKKDGVNNNELFKFINARDVESLLNSSTQGVSLAHKCNIVLALGKVVQSSPSPSSDTGKIVNDVRFQNLCNIMENANFQQNPLGLLHALEGLYTIGLNEDDNLLKVLENDLKWVIRRCPVRLIAKAVEILSAQTSSSGNNITSPAKLHSNHPLVVAIETLQRRWVEASTGSDFIAIFKIISSLKEETKLKLEDRAVEVVQDFSAMEMLKMIVTLGSQKRRSTPLLRALAFHLSKTKEKVPAKDMIELIYALNSLTFADPVLMAKICNDLYPEIATIVNPPLISSLITSLGQMRYKHNALLLAVDNWIKNNLSKLRPFDCATWLLTSSILNMQSENTTNFCNTAKQILTKEKAKSPANWVNIVHALVILNQANPSVISSILEPNFLAKLDSDKFLNSKLKLLQVNAASKHMKDYSGPYLSDEILAQWTPAVVQCSDDNLSKAVIETLGNFLPRPKYLSESRPSSSGVFVDATCLLNVNMDPVPLTTKTGPELKLIQVAIVVQGYSSFCLGASEPTGQTKLAVQLLEREGYYVVPVPFTEFNIKEKLLPRVQYLEQKIREIDTTVENSSTVASQASDNAKKR